jgi:hypothetical protein
MVVDISVLIDRIFPALSSTNSVAHYHLFTMSTTDTAADHCNNNTAVPSGKGTIVLSLFSWLSFFAAPCRMTSMMRVHDRFLEFLLSSSVLASRAATAEQSAYALLDIKQ